MGNNIGSRVPESRGFERRLEERGPLIRLSFHSSHLLPQQKGNVKPSSLEMLLTFCARLYLYSQPNDSRRGVVRHALCLAHMGVTRAWARRTHGCDACFARPTRERQAQLHHSSFPLSFASRFA